MVVMLGETMGLVADVLKKPQGITVAAQTKRLVGAGRKDELLAFGQ
jgi:hypothetical protein